MSGSFLLPLTVIIIACVTLGSNLVSDYVSGKLPIDHYVTHELHGIDKTNEAFDVLHGGECIRVVVHY